MAADAWRGVIITKAGGACADLTTGREPRCHRSLDKRRASDVCGAISSSDKVNGLNGARAFRKCACRRNEDNVHAGPKGTIALLTATMMAPLINEV
ncbi:hypothetical protein JYU34_016841, partial [Plutella xylostella]